MKTEKTLLKDYIAADDEQRLSMFLTHRGLRRKFVGIDVGEWRRTKVLHPASISAEKPKTALQRAAGCCRGWLRYCRADRQLSRRM